MCYAWYHFQFPGIKYFVIHYLITWHCLLRTYSIVRHGFLLFCSFALHKLKMYGQLHILWDNLKFGSTMKLVLLLSHLHKSLSLQEKVEEVHWNFLITENLFYFGLEFFLHSNILRISWRTQQTRHSWNNLKRNFNML